MDELETKVNELIGSERYKEAIKYLYRQLDSKEGKDQSKDRAQIHELLGRVYNVKGDSDRALKCVFKACDEYHAIDGVYKYADSFLIDGDHRLKDGDFINAQTVYKSGLLMFPDKEALKHGLKNAKVMEERNAALNASKLIQEEEHQKKKGGPKINEGKLIQKKKGSSNRGKGKVIEVEKQENLIREEKQKKLIQEEPLEKKGVNSGGKEVKRMDQEDIHNQCEDNVHSSDSTTFTVSSKITLFAYSCQGTLESDSNDPVPKSFLTPTNFQADNFNVLHALCSSDINLVNVENLIKDCNKTALLLVTEPVKTLEGFFNNELKKISSSGLVTRKLWWEHIALMFRQIFRDYSRGLLFLFSSSSGFCGDLSFILYVTNDGKGKILPSLKSKVNQGLRRLQRQDVADWVNQMVKVISLPFKKAVKVNEDELEIPLELKKLLRCKYCTKHK